MVFRLRSNVAREFFAEFLGTFIMLSFGEGSVAQAIFSRGNDVRTIAINWGWGIGVMMGIYVAGGVSGAHLNPAVTVAQAVLRRLPWFKVPIYCLAQYLGAFVASGCVYLVYYDAIRHYDGGTRQVTGADATAGIWATYPQSYVSSWNSLGDELFGTTLLVICILGIVDPRNMAPSKGLTAISVGLLVVGIISAFSLNCGAAINPARDLAPRIFSAVAGWGKETFAFRDYTYFWVNVVGPHVGGVLGALVYQLCVGLHWPPTDDGNEELIVMSEKHLIVKSDNEKEWKTVVADTNLN